MEPQRPANCNKNMLNCRPGLATWSPKCYIAASTQGPAKFKKTITRSPKGLVTHDNLSQGAKNTQAYIDTNNQPRKQREKRIHKQPNRHKNKRTGSSGTTWVRNHLRSCLGAEASEVTSSRIMWYHLGSCGITWAHLGSSGCGIIRHHLG